MKKIIILLAIIMTSCQQDRKLELTNSKTVVINKAFIKGFKSPDVYKIKTFNGNDVEWFYVSKENYDIININDTLTNFSIKK